MAVNGEVAMGFPDLWLWLVFVIAGLLLVLLALIVGVVGDFDLVFIGSAFIVGGLTTWPFHSWLLTVIVTSLICIAYVALGRRFSHRLFLWTTVSKAKTNIDAIINRQGIVLKSIARNVDGRVKVGNEQWRARAEEDIKQGEEIVVTGVSGNTLIVEKNKGGN